MSRWMELAVPGVAIALLVALCVLVTARDLQRWSRQSGVLPEGAEQEPVRRSIRTTRTAGVLGGVLGLVVVPIASGGRLGGPTAWFTAGAVMVALLVVGELGTHRPRGAVAQASLDVRSVDQYQPPRAAEVARWAGLAAMALAALAPLVPAATRGAAAHPSGALVAGVLLAAPLTLVVIEWAQRWIVARPQAVASARERTIDDAIRARSVHVLVGAALFLELQLLGISLFAVGFRRQWDLLLVASIVIGFVGLIASVRVSNRRWAGRAAVPA